MAGTAIWEIPNFPRDKQNAKLEILSIQFGTSRSNATGNSPQREGGSPNIQDIVVTREMDDYSGYLFNEALNGTGRPMNFYLIDKTGNTIKTYLSIYLENALISSYNQSGGGGGDKPIESLSINFSKITYKYEAPSEK